MQLVVLFQELHSSAPEKLLSSLNNCKSSFTDITGAERSAPSFIQNKKQKLLIIHQ
jgi:hypothetical protein